MASKSPQIRDTSDNVTEPPTNQRGIPSFPFMESVSAYVTTTDDVEPTLRRFQEMIAKYQFMEANVGKRAAGLREKLPEMEGTLNTVQFLQSRKASNAEGLETTFSLSDTLFARALIEPNNIDEVYLWLGANVMVAYPLAEAEEMLTGRVKKAKQTLTACEEDLEFLRVQITTVEVATARVYNWDVVEKRKTKEKGVEVEERGS